MKKEEKEENVVRDSEIQNKYLYRLVGVLVHSGGADSGHYYSYIKERKEDGRWLEFNDTTVRPFDFAQLERECFGKPTEGQKVSYVTKDCTNAYLLFYEKVHKEENDMQLPTLQKTFSQHQRDLVNHMDSKLY